MPCSPWLLPFVFAFCTFPLKASHAPLFDTLMGVAVTVSTVVLGCIYLRDVRSNFLHHGVRIGTIWTVANWLLDATMFSGGPMKMSLAEYTMDIGLAYLAIPAVTIGLGCSAAATARGQAAISNRD